MKERITISIDKNLSKALNFLKKKKEKSLFINNVLKDFLLNSDDEKLLEYFNEDDLKYIKMFLKNSNELNDKTIEINSKIKDTVSEELTDDIPEIDENIEEKEETEVKIKKRF